MFKKEEYCSNVKMKFLWNTSSSLIRSSHLSLCYILGWVMVDDEVLNYMSWSPWICPLNCFPQAEILLLINHDSWVCRYRDTRNRDYIALVK